MPQSQPHNTEERNRLWHESEQFVVDYLVQEGYTIRERNWRPRNTKLELDIIAENEKVIVFVEVKSRKSDDADMTESVNRKKAKNIIRAAEIYFRTVGYDKEYRFDIINIKGTPGNFVLEHLPDAFLPF